MDHVLRRLVPRPVCFAKSPLKPMVEGLIPWVTGVLELAGIATTLLGAAGATFIAVRRVLAHGATPTEVYERYRRQLSQGILLGLEFLVAADIIGTVAVEPTFRSLGVLGLIVAIRTFLSFTLEVEIAGRWPWYSPVEATAIPKLRDFPNRP